MPEGWPKCPKDGSTDVVLIYDCTVGVSIVDGEIDRVVVEDENFSPKPSRIICYRCGIYDHKVKGHPALKVAEEEWPRWEFGW